MEHTAALAQTAVTSELMRHEDSSLPLSLLLHFHHSTFLSLLRPRSGRILARQLHHVLVHHAETVFSSPENDAAVRPHGDAERRRLRELRCCLSSASLVKCVCVCVREREIWETSVCIHTHTDIYIYIYILRGDAEVLRQDNNCSIVIVILLLVVACESMFGRA